MFEPQEDARFLPLDPHEEHSYLYPLCGLRGSAPFTEKLDTPYRVVMLDIDGTINGPLDGPHAFQVQPNPQAVLDRKCIARLNQITTVSGAYIVISSAWRYRFKKSLPKLLAHAGVEGRIIGMTPLHASPHFSGTATRGQEIVHWLRLLNEEGHALPEGLVVLDDLDDLKPLHDYTVRVDQFQGLRDADVAHALGLLAKPFRFTIPPWR